MASALNTTNSYVNLELSSSQNDNISEGQLKMKHDNPLLCYLVHKMDIINQELLVKVASEFYTDLEVETAKELLFRTVSTGVRNIKRKGSEKRTQNIIDMLGILHKTKEEDIPMFEVFDLTRLPSLDLNFIDVTTLSQDIKQIRSEIKDCEPQVNQQKIEVMSRDIVTMKDNMKLMEKQLTEVLKCLRSAPEGKLGDKNVTPSTLKLPPAMTQKTITPSRRLPRTPVFQHAAENGPGAIPKEKPVPTQEMTYSKIVSQPTKLLVQSEELSSGSKDEDDQMTFKTVSYKKQRRRDKAVVGKAKTAQAGLGGRGRFVSLCLFRDLTLM